MEDALKDIIEKGCVYSTATTLDKFKTVRDCSSCILFLTGECNESGNINNLLSNPKNISAITNQFRLATAEYINLFAKSRASVILWDMQMKNRLKAWKEL